MVSKCRLLIRLGACLAVLGFFVLGVHEESHGQYYRSAPYGAGYGQGLVAQGRQPYDSRTGYCLRNDCFPHGGSPQHYLQGYGYPGYGYGCGGGYHPGYYPGYGAQAAGPRQLRFRIIRGGKVVDTFYGTRAEFYAKYPHHQRNRVVHMYR